MYSPISSLAIPSYLAFMHIFLTLCPIRTRIYFSQSTNHSDIINYSPFSIYLPFVFICLSISLFPAVYHLPRYLPPTIFISVCCLFLHFINIFSPLVSTYFLLSVYLFPFMYLSQSICIHHFITCTSFFHTLTFYLPISVL